jgi:hypothetical protein
MDLTDTEVPSLLAFGPQSDLASQDTINPLRILLDQLPVLSPLRDSIEGLTEFWNDLVDFDASLREIPGIKYITELHEWLVEGGPLPSHKANAYLLPLTVLFQVTQYFQYLQQLNTSNPHERVIENLRNGSVQGFCVGFLSAVIVAASKTEADIAATAAVILRLSVCIGAYVDKAQLGSQEEGGTCLAVSWKKDVVDERKIRGVVDSFAGVSRSS